MQGCGAAHRCTHRGPEHRVPRDHERAACYAWSDTPVFSVSVPDRLGRQARHRRRAEDLQRLPSYGSRRLSDCEAVTRVYRLPTWAFGAGRPEHSGAHNLGGEPRLLGTNDEAKRLRHFARRRDEREEIRRELHEWMAPTTSTTWTSKRPSRRSSPRSRPQPLSSRGESVPTRCGQRARTTVQMATLNVAGRRLLRPDGLSWRASMSVASCGCDSYFSGQAAAHCSARGSFADRPAYDAYRRLARPCLHPAVLGMEPLDDRGWAAARDAA